jgi:MFS family permease
MFLNLAYMWMIAAVFDTLVPFYASYQLGLSTFGVGAIFAVVLVAEFAVLYPAGSAADRHGRKTMLVPALAGLAAATVSVGRAGTPCSSESGWPPSGWPPDSPASHRRRCPPTSPRTGRRAPPSGPSASSAISV